MSEVGVRIKKLREKEGLNQRELAKKLNIANSTLSQYETGQRVPSDDMKVKIANLFNVTTDYLLGRTDSPDGKKDEIHTIAAHHDGDEFTEEELEEIEKFKQWVLDRRKK